MGMLVEDTVTDYMKELTQELLRLRQENPLCWQKMSIQLDVLSEAEMPSRNILIHWLDKPSVYSLSKDSAVSKPPNTSGPTWHT
jgi:hypothetical protein